MVAGVRGLAGGCSRGCSLLDRDRVGRGRRRLVSQVDQSRCADKRPGPGEARGHDLNFAYEFEVVGRHGLPDDTEKVRRGLGESAADHDQLQIQQSGRAGDRLPNGGARPGDGGASYFVAKLVVA